MSEGIRRMRPFYWECFRVPIIEGKNDSESMLRNALTFTITAEDFEKFCKTHSDNECFISELNNIMKSSCLVLDEYMCFLNKGAGSSTQLTPGVGVEEALKHVNWNKRNLHKSGGIYEWSKIDTDHSQVASGLD
ncbi:MAG: hypothetical protein M1813_005428 [Trichoglossum hirsutum]|nr:MAG: hypothetical protein M1813_005428 [Trichoglossum hirsutum]